MAFPRSSDSTDDDGVNFNSTVLPLAQRTDIIHFLWTAGVFCVLVAVWTGLRIYSRTVRQMPLGLEDMLYHTSVVRRCPFYFEYKCCLSIEGLHFGLPVPTEEESGKALTWRVRTGCVLRLRCRPVPW